MLLNFLVYVTLPVLLKYSGILLGVGSVLTYINAIIGLAKRDNYFWEQVRKIKFYYFGYIFVEPSMISPVGHPAVGADWHCIRIQHWDWEPN